MPNVTLDLHTILLVIAVVLLAANSISTLAKGRRDWHDLSGRTQYDQMVRDTNARIQSLEDWRGTIENRLERGNHRFEEINRDTMEILLVLRTMIQHMQSGNDHAKLQETDDKLYKYLVEKRGVNPSAL